MPGTHQLAGWKERGQPLTDGGFAAGGAVLRRDLEEAVCVDLECCDELRLAPRHRRDAIQLELTEQAVVAALGALALIHGECHRGLVVLNGGKCPRLVCRDGGIPWDNDAEYVALHRNAEGERGDIEQ